MTDADLKTIRKELYAPTSDDIYYFDMATDLLEEVEVLRDGIRTILQVQESLADDDCVDLGPLARLVNGGE